tara:strand:- start:844 stop:1140 length:297 start_codon:yes stop_codon:yes gene_type:complete
MNILPEIFDKQAKFKPWLWEKYGDTFDDEKNRKKRAENEAELKYKKDRMMHGPKKTGHSKDSPTYKQFVAKAKAGPGLKRGEVKRYDKKKKKWVSNKD